MGLSCHLTGPHTEFGDSFDKIYKSPVLASTVGPKLFLDYFIRNEKLFFFLSHSTQLHYLTIIMTWLYADIRILQLTALNLLHFETPHPLTQRSSTLTQPFFIHNSINGAPRLIWKARPPSDNTSRGFTCLPRPHSSDAYLRRWTFRRGGLEITREVNPQTDYSARYHRQAIRHRLFQALHLYTR